ncbi:MAG: 4-oxalocrotonate tautomerase family protein [Anaerolineae bacterium]|nr:4-oxalocrotonate tautomerase family protein [Anaerolineae bacterium]
MPTVIIYWSPGRTQEQKADVVREVTDALVRAGNARREDVLIIFQDIQPGDAGRGGVITPAPSNGSNLLTPSD